MSNKIILSFNSGRNNKTACLNMKSAVLKNSKNIALSSVISDLLTDSNMKVEELSYLAFCRGPGSFTAMRNNLSVARGLLFAQKHLKYYAFSGGEVMILNSNYYLKKDIMTIIDSGRGDFYIETFKSNGLSITALASKKRIYNLTEKYDIILTYGVDMIFEHRQRQLDISATTILSAARKAIDLKIKNNFNDLTPLYLRPSYAEEV